MASSTSRENRFLKSHSAHQAGTALVCSVLLLLCVGAFFGCSHGVASCFRWRLMTPHAAQLASSPTDANQLWLLLFLLGHFFQSKNKKKQESEEVVVVVSTML